MTQKLTIRLTTLLVAACLVAATTPALAAPVPDASFQEPTLATRALHALQGHLQDLWSDLAAPTGRLSGAQGNKPDPTGEEDPVVDPQAGHKVDPDG